MSATVYTLAKIREVSDQLQADVDAAIEEIRHRAEDGDKWAQSVIAEWERLGEPEE